MKFMSLAALALAAALAPVVSRADVTPAPPPLRLGPPITHENLTIFPVRGASANPSSLVTLQDAMAGKLVRVYETGDVNSLQVENLSDKEIFIQAGDIVKGGRQDRVLSVDLVLPPKSGRLAIDAFCVEHGRWSGRGTEKADAFGSSTSSLPSKSIKLATRDKASGGSTASPSPAEPQQKVWAGVQDIQLNLQKNIGKPVAAANSPTSLQLTMENDRLKASIAEYEKAFAGLIAQNPDAVGYVMAINGKINSADIYDSPALFQLMWPKMLNAAAIEALSEKSEKPLPPVGADAPQAFLDQIGGLTPKAQKVSPRVTLLTRENDQAVGFDTQLSDGRIVHRNYLAK